MQWNRSVSALLVLVLAAVSSLAAAGETRPVQFRTQTMGTWATLTLVTADSASVADLALNGLLALHEVDSLMTNWTEISEVARLNREAGQGATTVHPEVLYVLNTALRVSEESGGAFDVTVEPLVRLWGFLGGEPRVAENKGTEGRARAEQEVTASLVGATESLDKALDGLAQALPTAQETESKPAPSRRRGRSRGEVRTGPSASEVGAVSGEATLASADLSGGTIVADGIAIAPLSDVQSGDVAATSSGSGAVPGATSSGGEVRSNKSLLAVVKQYASAIQFCYENELKKNPGLRGKLVVSLTVLANGSVRDAVVVDDGLGSAAVTGCALAQIVGWQFPAVEAGVTSFRIPFLFTPPE